MIDVVESNVMLKTKTNWANGKIETGSVHTIFEIILVYFLSYNLCPGFTPLSSPSNLLLLHIALHLHLNFILQPKY